jgi:two-component SAPR family response regulator
MWQHPTESPIARPALRVLVVEDNLLIAETLCDMLENCGCEVMGPAPNLEGSLTLLADDHPDGALLDINLSGTLSFPLAAVLAEQGIPFVFVTGYDEGTIFPDEFRSIRRISKPFDRKEVEEVVEVWGRMGRA